MSGTTASHRKKRGCVRASITKLHTRLDELEGRSDSGVHDQAKQLLTRVSTLDAEFKTHHFLLVDTIDETDAENLAAEQGTLDDHYEIIDKLTVRIQHLLSTTGRTVSTELKSLTLKLRHFEEAATEINSALDALLMTDEGVRDVALVQAYKEELSDLKEQLKISHERVNSMEGTDRDTVLSLYSSIKKLHFTCCHKIQQMLCVTFPNHEGTPTTTEGKGVKVPKLEAPIFDGNILNWTRFWEQFAISIDGNPNLTKIEKFVYLQQSLKGGSAKSVIDGLTGTGEHYTKAIECLKSRYDRPRLIHQSHVKTIIELPPLKEGSGRELRKLYDTLQQHLRALDSADSEPFSQFITSLIQLKLDPDTMFEWQKYTQDNLNVPHYDELLEFIDLRARASESTVLNKRSAKPDAHPKKSVASFVANSQTTGIRCVSCKSEKHPLYHCPKFRNSSHDEKLAIVKTNNYCINCLRPGHFSKDCKSSHRCKCCQQLHHSLLHVDTSNESSPVQQSTVSSNTAIGVVTDTLLMTCQVLVSAPDGSKVKVRCLLDSASSMSFASERLIQSLRIPRSHHPITISGIAGMSDHSPLRSVAHVNISPVGDQSITISVPAIVIPRVTCDLPLQPVNYKSIWTHLSGITLADPEFGQPGKVDLLLGIDVYAEVVLAGRRTGPPGAPVAFETTFGWVLAGRTSSASVQPSVVSHHVSVTSNDNDDILRRFWEIEETPNSDSTLTIEERKALSHFKENHYQNGDGRFVVPLPKDPNSRVTKPLGESRSRAVRRLIYLERSLHSRNAHKEFEAVIQEYFDLGHAEAVPAKDLNKSENEVFYLPLHVVYKASSTTTKVRAVFDASAKSSTGFSLNDQLLVGPTVHSSLVDVLLRFRLKRIAITTDISKMYRAIELAESDRDLHRFVWRSSESDTIKDYRMTRLTFGISASSFIANMCVKQNATNLALQYPLAAKAVQESFYVDDGLTGSDDITTAIRLQKELQEMFLKGGFQLHKWNSSEPAVIQQIHPSLRDATDTHLIADTAACTKTLGLQWKTDTDQFHVTVSQSPATPEVTKRLLISDIARLYDVFGWFSPTVIKVKILFQKFWEQKIDWDEPAPPDILNVWRRWREELPQLVEKPIPRCYHPKAVRIKSQQLHGFSDASEDAYAAVVYLRMVDECDNVHVSLVMSKTKVSPIKRLTIPRLELCGAVLLAQLLNHVKEIFEMPMHQVHAWTDSSVVLSWLSGSPRRFKTYVGNRVATIVEIIPPERWRHVRGTDNPADCASRGLYPSELVDHQLWWNGPAWLHEPPDQWPIYQFSQSMDESVIQELCHISAVMMRIPSIVDFKNYSSYERLKRIIAWTIRFINNTQPQRFERIKDNHLHTREIIQAESYIFFVCQRDCFLSEINIILSKGHLPKGNCLLPLSPFIDSEGVLRVGGRQEHSTLPYSRMHPIILHGSHHVTKLIIRYEHHRLLHGGATLVAASITRRFHIIRMRSSIRSIVRQCVPCRRQTLKTSKPILGQLPVERLTPGSVFDKTMLDPF